jgi:hypothetical protein
MSDEAKKPAGAAQGTAGKPQTVQSSAQHETVPEDVVTPVDGEIDLARLAPQLRGLYQELLNEPVPDRFTRLLDELTRKETGGQ